MTEVNLAAALMRDLDPHLVVKVGDSSQGRERIMQDRSGERERKLKGCSWAGR